jgi:DNA-directed RNA polymerase
MLTQIELEKQMYAFGRARTENMMTRNEEGGRADNNPYAKAIYRRFVLPLAEIIREDLKVKKAGRRKAHSILLEPMDPEAVAYLAVRNTLNTLMNGGDNPRAGGQGSGSKDSGGFIVAGARAVVSAVGKAAYHELLLGLFEEAAPDLFYTLVNDLGRRMSKSERHRMTVFKMQAKDNGIPFPEWGAGGVQQVGSYLVDALEGLGLVETFQNAVAGTRSNQVRQTIEIRLSVEVLELISQIKGHIIETTPYYLPCVEAPKDWISVACGGFHTTAMRRMQPYAVRSHGSWSEFEDHDMSTPLAAINALQRVPWQINGPMLDAIRTVAKHFDMEEILSQAEFPAPAKPDWLIGDMKTDDMSPAQAEEFVHWKRQKAEWFTQMKLRGTKYGRFYTATTVADKFREFPAIYFVYFADFRGRLYAQTTGVSPQGSDMQKALLRFAVGKPLDTLDAQRWFCIHGANKWGFDKASLDDRVKWVEERKHLLLDFAADPVANDGWTEADSPLQFLAWCMEYAAWQTAPHSFASHLPVGMDGSCNGLQNFSAMLRDAVGGKATNLIPADKPNDIYQMVADVATLRLRQYEPQEVPTSDGSPEQDSARDKVIAANSFRTKWLAHGLNRSLVKRSVMTLPYGSTRFSCADFIVGDYLKLGKAKEFEKEEYNKAAQFLSHFVWDAIAEVVVKAREAMNWLQACARQIIKNGDEVIRWKVPSGFPVAQRYHEQDSHRIRTNLCGNAFLRISIDNETPDINRHRNGVAPNFVHSYDASHLALTTVAAEAEGLHLAMIHDDYGTHAADAAALYRIIREVFVAMYESSSPLEELAAAYNLPQPPELGDLDLRAVLNSPYFFS